VTLPYSGTVLEHFRRPRNQRRIEAPAAAYESFNPLCGDRVRIELATDGRLIQDAAFTANACAICTASASLLTERILGKPIEVAGQLEDDEIVRALESDIPPGRQVCATLPLRALREAIAGLTTAT
jgi:nitrogen fixation protein NifU and related proteins